MKKLSTIFVAAVILISLGLGQGQIAIPEPVQKIFSRSCGVTGCHQGKYPAMNMGFEPDKIIGSTINVPSQEKPDLKIINTAEPANSYILMKIRGDKDIVGKRMPLNATPLNDVDIQSIQNWINGLKGTPATALARQGPGENGQKKSMKIPPSGELRSSTSPRLG